MLPTSLPLLLLLLSFPHSRGVDPSLPPRCFKPPPLSYFAPCSCSDTCSFFSDCCHRSPAPGGPHCPMALVEANSLFSGLPKRRVWVVNRCPSSSKFGARIYSSLCEDPPLGSARISKIQRMRLTLPVVSGSRLFKNEFCARCHKVAFRRPKMTLRCKKALRRHKGRRPIALQEMEQLKRKGNCKIVTKLPFKRLSSCKELRSIISRCPKIPQKVVSMWLQLSKRISAFLPVKMNISSLSRVRNRCLTDPNYIVTCDRGLHPVSYRNPYCLACQWPMVDCKILFKRRTPPLKEIGSQIESGLREDSSDKLSLGEKPDLGNSGQKTQLGPNGFLRNYRYDILLNFKRLADEEMQNFFFTQPLTPLNLSDFAVNATNCSCNGTQTRPPRLLDSVAGALGLACSLLSILALLLLLIVYSALPALRTLGGLLTMSLSASLLLALLCFLLGPFMSRWEPACRALACLTYMAFVSSFAWSSLFAVDLVRTFTSATGAAHGSDPDPTTKWWRYAKASCVGWLLPLLVGGTAVVVDQTAPSSWPGRPRFGLNSRCFFGSGVGLLAWFYCPVALAVSANCVLTTLLFRSLWTTAAQTRRLARKEGGRSTALLCLKVTLIFGLTWTAGLVAEWIEQEEVRAVAGVVNSLQGLSVGLTFVATPRVWRGWRKGKRSGRTSTTKSTPVRSDETQKD